MAQKKKDWNGLMSGFKASDLVFLDESGFNTDMTRRLAYSLSGSRAVNSALLSKPKNTPILSSIQLNGTLHYTTFSGGTTVDHFRQYLEDILPPHLNDDSVLAMDNMKSYHAKAVKELLDSSGIRYIYLPPYSPMTGKLALPTLIALCSIALGRPTVSTLAVLGEISISGTILKVDELANSLQVCLDSGAKKVLLPITSAADLGSVPPELVGSFILIFYSSAEDAVFKAPGVE